MLLFQTAVQDEYCDFLKSLRMTYELLAIIYHTNGTLEAKNKTPSQKYLFDNNDSFWILASYTSTKMLIIVGK
jgi:hypothetical protein